MTGPHCVCHWCGDELAPNTGLIAYGFCCDEHRRENNRAAMAGLTPAQARELAALAAEEAA